MKRVVTCLAIASLMISPAAHARTKPVQTWAASRITDPITGATRCIVSATDRAAGMRMTRVGALYPVVELNSEHGLLVGVSSGGRVRIPTGDIVWRVDDRPFHELKVADNPVGHTPSALPDSVAAQLGTSATENMNRMIAAASATSTMASGEKAKALLAEMIAGRGLLFRNTAVQSFGLADPRAQEVGQITREGLTPILLDESFRTALAECGMLQDSELNDRSWGR